MSDSGDTMGSLLGPEAPAPEDPDPEAPSVAIDIGNDADGDAGLEARMARLMTAHAEEQHRLELRVRQLEQLALASTVAEAAASSAASASSAAASAEAAAKLIEKSEGVVQCAAEVLAATREAMRAFGSDGNIQSLLSDHCVSAATSAKDAVLQALDECREDVEEFVEETQQRAEQKAVGKRGSGKKR